MLPPDVVLARVVDAPSPPQPLIPVETLIARAATTRADLRALRQSAQRASFEADAARRLRRPSPNVTGGMKRADDDAGRETGGVFGLSLSIPLFDAGGRDAARWTAERARIDAERAAIQSRIRSEITAASAALSIRQAALSQDQEGAARELTQIAEVAYREGEVGILELLDAVRTAARARFRSIDMRLDLRLAEIAMERAVGDTLWP
jgi:cobalt-zinc-cadmium efflux system outer membrane protein